MQFVRGSNVSSDTEGLARVHEVAARGSTRKLLKNERGIEAEACSDGSRMGATGSDPNTRRALRSISRADSSTCYVNMFSRSCLLNEYRQSFAITTGIKASRCEIAMGDLREMILNTVRCYTIRING